MLEVTQKLKNWPVLAADGGLNSFINEGLFPQMVIGDMDSVTHLDQLPVSVRQIGLSGQDDTDFEKCIRLINAPLIVGLGFMDGRLDHSLAVLDAMARLEHDRPVFASWFQRYCPAASKVTLSYHSIGDVEGLNLAA